jgi:hypothetical protein
MSGMVSRVIAYCEIYDACDIQPRNFHRIVGRFSRCLGDYD